MLCKQEKHNLTANAVSLALPMPGYYLQTYFVELSAVKKNFFLNFWPRLKSQIFTEDFGFMSASDNTSTFPQDGTQACQAPPPYKFLQVPSALHVPCYVPNAEARGQMLSWLALALTLPTRLLKAFEFVTPISFTWEVQSFPSLAPLPAA